MKHVEKLVKGALVVAAILLVARALSCGCSVGVSRNGGGFACGCTPRRSARKEKYGTTLAKSTGNPSWYWWALLVLAAYPILRLVAGFVLFVVMAIMKASGQHLF